MSVSKTLLRVTPQGEGVGSDTTPRRICLICRTQNMKFSVLFMSRSCLELNPLKEALYLPAFSHLFDCQ